MDRNEDRKIDNPDIIHICTRLYDLLICLQWGPKVCYDIENLGLFLFELEIKQKKF